ncbi:MAG: hypothetical protein ACRBB6_15775 [Neptuniibacter sp.]
MQRLVLVIIVAAIAVAAYFFWTQQQDQSQVQQGSSENVKPETQQAAKAHINRLTEGADTPISISKADNFVTSDQLISLPEKQAQSSVALTPLEEQAASGAEAGVYAAASHLQVIGSSEEQNNTNQKLDSLTIANQIKLRELLDDPDSSAHKVYFIHAVNEGDDEGLWGIIQHGLMRTFTNGLELPGMDKTVYADIPKEADEKLADKRSSFLGKILKNKVDRTYIYNYKQGILGENPDLIKPGQQLIVVTFTEQELIGIYNHFVNL